MWPHSGVVHVTDYIWKLFICHLAKVSFEVTGCTTRFHTLDLMKPDLSRLSARVNVLKYPIKFNWNSAQLWKQFICLLRQIAADCKEEALVNSKCLPGLDTKLFPLIWNYFWCIKEKKGNIHHVQITDTHDNISKWEKIIRWILRDSDSRDFVFMQCI